MCVCSAELNDQNVLSARDELILRWSPTPDPKAVMMRFKAKAKIEIDLEMKLGVCPEGSAWTLAHAKARFAPGLWTIEIAREMETESLRAMHVAKSFDDPGLTIGGGVQVGTTFGIDWNIPPGGRIATFHDAQEFYFNALSCLAPPSDNAPHNYVFFIELQVDTDASVSNAKKAHATAEATNLALSVEIEDDCAECTDPQPALPPGSTGGG